MTKTTLLGFLALSGLAALVSCDNGQDPTIGGLDANDCPYGTFRPAGLGECVFPADDLNNVPFGVSDNRCAFGQPAIPPHCVSDNGERNYLSIATKCAPNYHYDPGACNRGGGIVGTAGAGPVNTGTAGAFGGDSPGTAGGIGAGTGEGGATGGDAAGAGALTGAGGTG